MQWYFRYWLGRRSLDDERNINLWKGTVNIFKGKLIKMVKFVDGRVHDSFISFKIRQILLYWGYVICYNFFFHINMSYYWFNRKYLLQKATDRYHKGGAKEKAAEYYLKNIGLF